MIRKREKREKRKKKGRGEKRKGKSSSSFCNQASPDPKVKEVRPYLSAIRGSLSRSGRSPSDPSISPRAMPWGDPTQNMSARQVQAPLISSLGPVRWGPLPRHRACKNSLQARALWFHPVPLVSRDATNTPVHAFSPASPSKNNGNSAGIAIGKVLCSVRFPQKRFCSQRPILF